MFSKMSALSIKVIINIILAKISSELCTGKAVTNSSIFLKDLDHSERSVENNEIDLGKNCVLMWNGGS